MEVSLSTYQQSLESGKLDLQLCLFYGTAALGQSQERLATLLCTAESRMKSDSIMVLRTPGRTELGGNHTDHNHGHVLAAGIQLDIMAVVAPVAGNVVTIYSDGFHHSFVVDLTDTAPRPQEHASSAAIVRGMADGFRLKGYAVHGFTACISSTIPMGAGLSSSAAFEVLVGRIFNHLFNKGRVDALTLARLARRAENLHFGKPCGFMDQIACAFGGILGLDFNDPENPVIQRIEADLSGTGYQLCVINTGGSHADLTPDYAAIPREMKAAAKILGKNTASEVTMEEFLVSIPFLREQVGDRAVLRLMHFLGEDTRAVAMGEALQFNDMERFIRLLRTSGDSSLRLLQNCSSPASPAVQPIPLALALSEYFLKGQGGCRVHGGGFAGTIQAFIPHQQFSAYRSFMDEIFGEGAVIPLAVRQPGHEVLQVIN